MSEVIYKLIVLMLGNGYAFFLVPISLFLLLFPFAFVSMMICYGIKSVVEEIIKAWKK